MPGFLKKFQASLAHRQAVRVLDEEATELERQIQLAEKATNC